LIAARRFFPDARQIVSRSRTWGEHARRERVAFTTWRSTSVNVSPWNGGRPSREMVKSRERIDIAAPYHVWPPPAGRHVFGEPSTGR
jgi:hypothetical protein